MAIILKHSGNTSATLVGSFGGGQGKRQAEDASKALDLIDNEKDRAAAAQRQHEALAAAAIQSQNDAIEARRRDKRSAEQQGIRDERLAVLQADRDTLDYERQGARDELITERDRENAILEQTRRRDDFVWQNTTQQKAELEKLANAEAEMLASDDYTPEEKGELRRRFSAKRSGIQPVLRPRPKTPAEKFKETTHTDPKTGIVYSVTPDGYIDKPLYQPPEKQPTWNDKVKAFQAATAYATDPEGKIDQTKFDEAMKRMGLAEEPQAPDLPDGGGNPWLFQDASAGQPAAGVQVRPGTMQPIAGFPPDLWGSLSDEDQQDALTMFTQRKPMGDIVRLARKVVELRRGQQARPLLNQETILPGSGLAPEPAAPDPATLPTPVPESSPSPSARLLDPDREPSALEAEILRRSRLRR